jgi:creatinine amidohydrolase
MKKGKKFPVMENMTVKEVREYLESKKSIIIPIGVTEQHGYHLPLCTDALIATHLAKMIGEQTETLAAPTFIQSFSGGGLPGTINISPAVMSLVMSDMLISLVSQGFRNFYLLLCHGGSENARSLQDAIKILLRTNPAFENVMVMMCGIWDFPVESGFSDAFRNNDWHAGWLETSYMMALAPDLVQMDQLELDEEHLLKLQTEHPDNYQHAEKIVDDKFVIPRMRQRPDIKVGAMGDPKGASVELGRKVVDGAVKAVSEKIMELESKADGVYKEIDFTPEPLIFDFLTNK